MKKILSIMLIIVIVMTFSFGIIGTAVAEVKEYSISEYIADADTYCEVKESDFNVYFSMANASVVSDVRNTRYEDIVKDIVKIKLDNLKTYALDELHDAHSYVLSEMSKADFPTNIAFCDSKYPAEYDAVVEKYNSVSKIEELIDLSDLMASVILGDGIENGNSMEWTQILGNKNLFYSFDENTKTLYISGSGYSYFNGSYIDADIRNNTETIIMSDYIRRCPDIVSSNFPALKKLVLSNSITIIPSMQFGGFKNLEEVHLPDQLKYISSYAFQKCTKLKSISIPDSVVGTCQGIFWGCTSLESVKWSKNANNIWSYTFDRCSSLKYVDIPSNVTYIATLAFGNSGLESIVIPNSVQNLGNSVFSGCRSLESVVLSENLSEIKRNTFNNCRSLSSINIPDSVTVIGGSAFNSCKMLKNITLPESVHSMGKYAFAYSGIEEITVPESVTEIGKGAFQGCWDLKTVTWNSALDLPDRVFRSKVTDTITIAGNAGKIGSESFYQTKASTVNLNSSVRELGYSAFKGSKNLSSINLGNVELIGDGTLKDCGSLDRNFVIPASIQEIGFRGLANNNMRITFEGEVPVLKDSFRYNSMIKIDCSKVNENLQNSGCCNWVVHNYDENGICTHCGAEKNSIQTVDIKSEYGYKIYNEHQILYYPLDEEKGQFLMFRGEDCTLEPTAYTLIGLLCYDEKPSEVRIPESVNGVPVNGLVDCLDNEPTSTLILPVSMACNGASLPNVSKYVFYQGDSAAIDYTYSTYQNTPWYKSQPSSIEFEDGVTYIGDFMFAYQNSVTELDIPSSVKTIGDNAFYRNDNLKTVTLNEGLEKIRYQSFAECESLEKVNLPESLTNMKDNSFGGDENLVLTVIKDSYGQTAAEKFHLTYQIEGEEAPIDPGEANPGEDDPGEDNPGDDPQNPPEGLAKPTISLGTGYGKINGKTYVEIPIKITDNPGISAIDIGLDYDRNVLELKEVKNGDIFEDKYFTVAKYPEDKNLVWSRNNATNNVETDGTLAILRFAIKDGAELGGEYPITISCNPELSPQGAIDVRGKFVMFECKPGVIVANDFIYGDVFEDDENEEAINGEDVTVMKQYISSGFSDSFDVKKKACNVDMSKDSSGEDSVNLRDVMIVERHVVGWKGYEELPYTKDTLDVEEQVEP